MTDPQSNATPSGLTVVTSGDSQEPGGAGSGSEAGEEHPEPMVSEPGKLMRIGMMLRELQQEVQRADVDQAGFELLGDIHGRAVEGLRTVLSGELRDELDDLAPALPTEPTESEVRLAQAQLIGWLEGLFQGIQAAIASQQQAARQQLEQMRHQRGLPSGQGQGRGEHGAGQYL